MILATNFSVSGIKIEFEYYSDAVFFVNTNLSTEWSLLRFSNIAVESSHFAQLVYLKSTASVELTNIQVFNSSISLASSPQESQGIFNCSNVAFTDVVVEAPVLGTTYNRKVRFYGLVS